MNKVASQIIEVSTSVEDVDTYMKFDTQNLILWYFSDG